MSAARPIATDPGAGTDAALTRGKRIDSLHGSGFPVCFVDFFAG
jgi:hypothetical protein